MKKVFVKLYCPRRENYVLTETCLLVETCKVNDSMVVSFNVRAVYRLANSKVWGSIPSLDNSVFSWRSERHYGLVTFLTVRTLRETAGLVSGDIQNDRRARESTMLVLAWGVFGFLRILLGIDLSISPSTSL